MAEFEATVRVGTDPETTFDYIADYENVSEWDPSVREAKSLGEGEPAAGSSYAVTTGFYGKAIETICEIEELDAPSRLVVSIDGGALRGVQEITVTAVDNDSGGAVVDYRLDVELRGAARFLNRGLKLALSGLGENAVEGLRKRLAKQPA